MLASELQALVYDILPPTNAIINCATGLAEQLSANAGQFFVGAQMAVSLYQTNQIISGIFYITAHVAYARTNKTKIVLIETEHSSGAV